MRTVRYFFAVSVLASALSLSTFAGDMHTGIAPQPEPTPATAQGEMQNGVAGDIHTTNSEAAGAGDSVAGVLGLVLGALSLL
jgi:hypothetical protein